VDDYFSYTIKKIHLEKLSDDGVTCQTRKNHTTNCAHEEPLRADCCRQF